MWIGIFVLKYVYFIGPCNFKTDARGTRDSQLINNKQPTLCRNQKLNHKCPNEQRKSTDIKHKVTKMTNKDTTTNHNKTNPCNYALWQTKARAPFVRSSLRYLCRCVMLINRISTEAAMWLLFCSCVCVTVTLVMHSIFSISPCSDSNATVMRM